ncbi:MAG: outer membrane protein assembly factor BamC [Endozoicomonadaceae bacterium]|nr:outer membrane protein assembly factor BamC [Endozoicomonadaceae bacterium]
MLHILSFVRFLLPISSALLATLFLSGCIISKHKNKFFSDKSNDYLKEKEAPSLKILPPLDSTSLTPLLNIPTLKPIPDLPSRSKKTLLEPQHIIYITVDNIDYEINTLPDIKPYFNTNAKHATLIDNIHSFFQINHLSISQETENMIQTTVPIEALLKKKLNNVKKNKQQSVRLSFILSETKKQNLPLALDITIETRFETTDGHVTEWLPDESLNTLLAHIQRMFWIHAVHTNADEDMTIENTTLLDTIQIDLIQDDVQSMTLAFSSNFKTTWTLFTEVLSQTKLNIQKIEPKLGIISVYLPGATQSLDSATFDSLITGNKTDESLFHFIVSPDENATYITLEKTIGINASEKISSIIFNTLKTKILQKIDVTK